MSEAKRTSLGISIGVGVLATLFLGALGAFGWLAWVWSRTPAAVRASVSPAKSGAVVAVALISVVATGLGFVMTGSALRGAFASVDPVEPSEKARVLAEGISNAMNWTVLALLPMPIVAVVVFVAGYRLLRAARGE